MVRRPSVSRDEELLKLSVVNSIIFGGPFADGIAIFGDGGGTGQAVFDVTYSNISVFESVWEGEGNINADPRFVDPMPDMNHGAAKPNFALQADSPCIDAGDPDSPPDQDGTRADMGAIEFVHGL